MATPDGAAAPADANAPAANPGGWVVQIVGHHYHNEDPTNQGMHYLYMSLIKNLRHEKVTLLDDQGHPVEYTMKEVGIQSPVIVDTTSNIVEDTQNNPNITGGAAIAPGAMMVGPGGAATAPAAQGPVPDTQKPSVTLKRFNFKIEFAWTPMTPSQREAARKADEPSKSGAEGEPKVAGADATQPQNK
jgi:type IV pilus assembly protein PilM